MIKMVHSDIHHGIVMWLEDSRWENDLEIENIESLKAMRERVKKQLREVVANPEHCLICGSLKYDLIIEFEGKQFAFALWKIVDKGKVVAETDYKKFTKYSARKLSRIRSKLET